MWPSITRLSCRVRGTSASPASVAGCSSGAPPHATRTRGLRHPQELPPPPPPLRSPPLARRREAAPRRAQAAAARARAAGGGGPMQRAQALGLQPCGERQVAGVARPGARDHTCACGGAPAAGAGRRAAGGAGAGGARPWLAQPTGGGSTRCRTRTQSWHAKARTRGPVHAGQHAADGSDAAVCAHAGRGGGGQGAARACAADARPRHHQHVCARQHGSSWPSS